MPDAPLDHRPDQLGREGQGRSKPGAYPGSTPETRKQVLVKLCWMLLWMLYLYYPVQDLVTGHYSVPVRVAGWVALAAFLAGYLVLVFFRSMRGVRWRGSYPLLVLMAAIAVTTGCTLSGNWLGLFPYLSVAVGAVLPARFALPGVALVTAMVAAEGLATGARSGALTSLLVPTFLSGAAMTGLQQLVGAMRELREARETAAQLAAAEERLRMARDLHDLLGHSLSLITLKSELAGRFMDADKDEAARAQVADIEQVARQSLIDVRGAVSGYRRPTLGVELAAARSALATAGVTLEAPPAVAEDRPGLGVAEAETLAWVLRESVTNIVRHADGATHCTLAMDETWDGEGARFAVLEISDNGRGPGKAGPGNGLSGLDERLALVGGRLETSPGRGGKGFRLRALVPLGVRVEA
ncbi:sensor histidine kinase [Kitasatospora sp. NBC_01287]|uniref:sensor histidine kinase n=1 Tax=Kitasatospora sp. NBC_01287 TaxID=2903573 RepID=UPI002251CAAB|nr:sensor histidine kinase [Kitasatospora sp. NBC_01287]MCX4746948.1 sensor histidine kinase [Kitasatospora sp. NBC_01287]